MRHAQGLAGSGLSDDGDLSGAAEKLPERNAHESHFRDQEDAELRG